MATIAKQYKVSHIIGSSLRARKNMMDLQIFAVLSFGKNLQVHHILPRSQGGDRKSTRLNSSHDQISYAVFCLKKKKKRISYDRYRTTRDSELRHVSNLL